jgi:hypothetical protein
MVTMPGPISYSDRMDIRVEPALRIAIQDAAAKHRVKVAELIRNLLWTGIALQGSDETPDVRPDGKRRYARLEGGAIVDVVYRDPTPDPELE